MTKFLDKYISFVSEFTETKNIVHVWSILTAISAMIGRTRYLQFGGSTIYPNMYTMIVGEPGTRKSTGIKLARRLCEDAGYGEFAFESGSKEAYFQSLSRRYDEVSKSIDLDIETSVNGVEQWEPPIGETHSFICSDEFDTFIGVHNMSFISVLGDLWDRDTDFRHETQKHGIVVIPKPNITILGGTTPSTFSSIFPAQALDHGFLSRLLMVPCRGLERKLPIPPAPNAETRKEIITFLNTILHTKPQPIGKTKGTDELFSEIYHTWQSPFDSRFAGYASRRHVHLLKLAIIFAALNYSDTITTDILCQAHTLLTYTELLMPDVIGEMGKGPHTTAMNLVINTLSGKKDGLSITALYKLLYREVRSLEELNGVLNLLRMAERIVTDKDGNNFALPSLIEIPKNLEPFIDRAHIQFLLEPKTNSSDLDIS